MKIQFDAPRGNAPDGRGLGRTIDLGDRSIFDVTVPRVGDSVYIDRHGYLVHAVDWMPYGDDDDPEPLVYVVLRG